MTKREKMSSLDVLIRIHADKHISVIKSNLRGNGQKPKIELWIMPSINKKQTKRSQ